MNNLALVVANSTTFSSASTAIAELSPVDAADRYALEHWTARGYCIEYTTNKSVLFHPPSNKAMSTDVILDEFEGWCARNRIKVKTDNYGTFTASLIARVRARMEKVYGSGFRPIPDRFYTDSNGAPLANTFKPFNPPMPADTTPPAMLLELFQRIAPVPEERKLLIEWTAAIFQRPLERPIWGVILTGDSKCGKSSLVSVIKAGLGGNHVNDSVTYPGLWEQFSTVHADYSLIALEDQIAPRDADTRLKQPMSAKSKMFSIKNEQKQVCRDMFSRYMVTSNERRPLRFDPTVRRWLALQFIDHPVSEADSVEFFDRFYVWLTTPEAAAQIVHYFRNIKIEVYNPNLCPRTATLEEMIGLSASVLHGFIKDYVADGHSFVDGQLHDFLKPQTTEPLKADILKGYLVNEGYQRTRRTITGWEKREYVWSKKPPGKRGGELTPEDEASMVEFLNRQPF
jgi:hypothetical protein